MPHDRPLPVLGPDAVNRGNDQTLSRGVATAPGRPGQEIGVLKCDIEFPSVVTVELGLRFSDPAETGAQHATVIAIVQWGTGGISHEAEIDWHMGATFMVAAEHIDIRARHEELGDAVFAQNLLLFANVGYYPQGHTRPTRSFPRVRVPPLGRVTVAVPPFAFAANIFADEVDYGNFDIEFRGGQGAASQLQFAARPAGAAFFPPRVGVRLNDATRFIHAINTDAEVAHNLAISFPLVL